jgi:hypothetical protein
MVRSLALTAFAIVTQIFNLLTGNSDRYEGQVRQGKRHGQGRLTKASGNTYEGQV